MKSNNDRTRHNGPDAYTNNKRTGSFNLANSKVTIESGDAGFITRIERIRPGYERELPAETVDALREVAEHGE